MGAKVQDKALVLEDGVVVGWEWYARAPSLQTQPLLSCYGVFTLSPG